MTQLQLREAQLSNHACMNALSVGGQKKGLNTKQLSDEHNVLKHDTGHIVLSLVIYLDFKVATFDL